MKEVKVQPLSKAFDKYGKYSSFTEPQGENFGNEHFLFYRDMVTASVSGMAKNTAFSVCAINKRPLIVDTLEIHNGTCEVAMPLDGDMLLQVAPASADDVDIHEKVEVFFVPKGTLVRLNSGVWHHAPYATEDKLLNVLIVLPERTYANDCIVKDLDKSDCVKIVE